MYLFRNGNTQKDRRFGIDLEIAHPQYSRQEFKNVIENIHSHVAVKGDPSLSGNESEIIITESKHTKDNDGLSTWKDILSTLESKGCKVSQRTGYHIHWDTDGMTPQAIYNVLALWYNYSNVIDYALPKIRRGSAININCLQRRELTKLKRLAKEIDDRVEYLFRAERILGHCREITCNATFKTIEFRKQQATLRKDVFENWIKFTQNIIKEGIDRDSFVGIKTQAAKSFQVVKNTDIKLRGSFAHTWRKVFQYYGGNRTLFLFWTDRAISESECTNTAEVIRTIRENIVQANKSWN